MVLLLNHDLVRWQSLNQRTDCLWCTKLPKTLFGFTLAASKCIELHTLYKHTHTHFSLAVSRNVQVKCYSSVSFTPELLWSDKGLWAWNQLSRGPCLFSRLHTDFSSLMTHTYSLTGTQTKHLSVLYCSQIMLVLSVDVFLIDRWRWGLLSMGGWGLWVGRRSIRQKYSRHL